MEKLTVFFIIIALILLFSNSILAQELEFDLDKYLEQSIKRSDQLKETELNIKAKEINLARTIADQEIRPSPLLLTQAELEFELAQKKFLRRKDELINEYLNDFFNYYKTKNAVLIHREYKDILTEELKNIENKYQAGSLTKSDLFQAEVELKIAENNLAEAQNNKNKIIFKIKQNLNLESENSFDIDFKESDLNQWKLNEAYSELMELALKYRIEIREAEINQSLKKINYELAQRGYSPQLKKEQAENDYLNSINQLKIVIDGIQIDLNNSYYNFQNSTENLKSDRSLIKSYSEALRVKKLYFEEDYITGTELLETEIDLYQAEINLANSQVDYYQSLAELYLSTGDFKELLPYVEK
jgi:outer membrane protein TolC